MKNVFLTPGTDERRLQFEGWRINSAFRISLLSGCSYSSTSLAEAAKVADVDFEKLKRFMDGQDGTLGYTEMEHLIKAVTPAIQRIMVVTEIENLDCNGPGPDDIPDDLKQHDKRYLDWAWEEYNKRGMEPDEKLSRK